VTRAGERHEPIPESWLDALDEQIAWRGPDGAGRFRDVVKGPDGSTFEVALVHRRLSIIDHEGGGQPFVVRGCPGCAAANRKHRQRWRERAAERGVTGIVDVDDCTEDCTAIAFNGCLYNHRELRAELESLGHVFTSDHSDTEVIAHAWAQWRETMQGIDQWRTEPAVVSRLDGMYALLLWNRAEAMLWSARDAHGEKPLYTAAHDQPSSRVVCLSSTVPGVRAVLERMGVEQNVDPHGVAANIALGFPPQYAAVNVLEGSRLPDSAVVEHSLYYRAHVIEPWIAAGETAVNTRTRMLSTAMGWLVGLVLVAIMLVLFWLLFRGLIAWLEFLISIFTLSGLVLLAVKIVIPWFLARKRHVRVRARVAPDTIDDVLSRAVGRRLESDVPLGCFLSGGVDSSLVAYYAHRRLGWLRTFCVRMPDERYDESAYAQAVADVIGTDHTTVECDASRAADDVVHLIELLGLPFGDSSILPTYWLCRAARAHVQVALSGDGGDEMFYGYDRYRAAGYLTGLLAPVAWWKHGRLDRSDPRGRDERMARFLDAATGAGYAELVGLYSGADARRLMGGAGIPAMHRMAAGSARAARWQDLNHYLPADLMRKVDTASMALGLEVRCPFLSNEIAKASQEIPVAAHMRGETKHILKQLARRHIGTELIDRPKQGFAIPISEWWRTDFGGLGTLLFELLDRPEPFGAVHEVLPINMGFVRQMIDEHWAAGGLPARYSTGHVRKRDHGQRLFGLVTLALWARSVHRRDAEIAESDPEF